MLNPVREKVRYKHYSLSTERTYISWIKHYIVFHGKRHPTEMGSIEVEQFLSYLANERYVSSATQNQALSAILFLYREVLELKLPWMDGFERSKKTLACGIKEPLHESFMSHIAGKIMMIARSATKSSWATSSCRWETGTALCQESSIAGGNNQASHHLIHCVIPLPRIFCRRVMIFGQCRNYWGTVMFQRRWFIRMFWIKVAKASSALWIIYEAKFIRLGFAGIDQLAFAMGASGSGWLVKLPN